ncbi:NADH-quinone oxidoreductase subunit L [Rubrobacter taiwanensis]|jgi:NADH-quinone oxidoreductase subunit L|uniref:NADH-quinone oxidoreductase subunit L n=1 Tax=Rubrobacter taiwanensis TaxID=185139 RepID=A0A4R1BPA8_9ACTN|nr:NADH-quinone oxidoreductase subunit L [Rubrobacter taiwanensis]TCJ19434.1 NADH-quinone oxidoreductase subunit L [Rubrobacter taiwanensis]
MSAGQQLLILAIPVLPALAFFVLALFGRLIGENAQYVAVFVNATAFIFSCFALFLVITDGPISFSVSWIDLGEGGSFSMGVLIDELAAVMIVVVTFVSLMINLYSGAFMEGDSRYAWYFAVLNLFTASMLGLVIAPNFIQLYVFWELVGLCSYLLIGHWFEKPAARDAAQKAFIVTRIGDAALLVGILIFWRATGTTSFAEISQAAQAGFIGGLLLTAALVLVFIGAVGKSAQFPLHVWLPDAMEGPTPVSALIHAATMVAAGVYLVARTYDIFVQSPAAMLIVAYIGGFTALMAATMALVKKDIKRIIAYSTVSQLGYMMMALGIGAYTAGFFHLYNHAFFKALLFLGAGSIIYAMTSYNIFDMGGLKRRMPITFWTMVIAGLSLAGIFPLAGFWSKDLIVAGAFEKHYYILFGMALVTVFLTAFYIFRAIFVAFLGEPRTEAARAAVDPPGVMTVPMVILAALSIGSGWIGTPVADLFGGFVTPSEFAAGVLAIEEHAFSYALAALSVAVGLAGIALAYAMYAPGREHVAESAYRRFRPVHAFLDRRWYIDDLYNATFVRGAMALGVAVREFDRRGLDGAVTGLGRAVSWTGERLRPLQTGGVQNYALFIVISVLALAAVVLGDALILAAGLLVLIILGSIAVGVRL